MKLVSSKQKQRNTIIIVAVAFIAIAAVIGLIVGLISNSGGGGLFATTTTREPLEMRGINISIYPTKTHYYVGEEFDPTGISVQVIMNHQDSTYFIGENELTFEGFDSSVVNDALLITASYKGYTTSFTVVVKEMPKEDPTLVSIRLSDTFQDTYTLDWWNTYGPDLRTPTLIATYSDGSEKEITDANLYKLAKGIEDVTAPGNTSFTIKYSENGIMVETTITVTITN